MFSFIILYRTYKNYEISLKKGQVNYSIKQIFEARLIKALQFNYNWNNDETIQHW